MREASTFQRKLAERRAREQVEAVQDSGLFKDQFDDDLVPESATQLSDEQMDLDRVVNNIDILDGYARWCGKSKPVVRAGQRESILISCPKPTHPDKNPSAWVNLDKQTWFCAGCQEGGDVHDIAAWHFGFPVPEYKQGPAFHELREQMAADFGFVFQKLPGGGYEQIDVVHESNPQSEVKTGVPEPTVPPEDKLADVFDLYEAMNEDIDYPMLDWKAIVPEETFLRKYMELTTADDVPEEYHFWNGLIALGFAVGRDVALFDSKPVYGNLFVCALGASGSGKSRAKYLLDQLIEMALPHKWDDPNSKGVRIIGSPGSAEVLVQNFAKPVFDVNNPKVIAWMAPVRGMIDFNELAGLVGRASRMGSVMKPTLMQFYDMEKVVSTTSLTTGDKRAEEPFASAITTTQPKALRDLVSRQDDASGFLNRWVFACGPEKQKYAIGGVRVDMAGAVAPLKEIMAWATTFRTGELMQWSGEAAKLFTEFFHTRIELDKKNSDSALYARLDLLIKKLIMLFAVNKKEKTVSEASVREAMACYEYIKQCYAIPAGQLGNTLNQEIADAITAIVRRHDENGGSGVTISMIARSLHRRKYPHDMILKTIDGLVKLGFLKVEIHKPIQGRPSTRYRYVS